MCRCDPVWRPESLDDLKTMGRECKAAGYSVPEFHMTQALWDDVARWLNWGHPVYYTVDFERRPEAYAFHPDQHGPTFNQCPYDEGEGIVNRTWEELNGRTT